MREVYLDNNATTPVAPEVKEAMVSFLTDAFGNPSSVHKKGIEAERAVKDARQKLARVLNAKEREIIFTSGATESDNLALRGLVHANKRRGTHIVSSVIEHEAVLDTLAALEMEGHMVTYLLPDGGGHIMPEQVEAAVRDDTVLVALMHVNNELGTIADINACAKAAKEVSENVIFFTDGAQAFGKLHVDLEYIDAYAVSAHKLHGPKGTGALYVKEGAKLEPQITGGGQEFGYRSGTENVGGIAGFARAIQLAYENLNDNRAHMQNLRQQFLDGISAIENIHINSPDDGLETTVNVSFPGVPAEVLLHALEERGIYVSTGSACSSKKTHRSHVIEALELSEEIMDSTLRIGFSRFNSEDEVAYAVEQLQDLVPELRRTVGRK